MLFFVAASLFTACGEDPFSSPETPDTPDTEKISVDESYVSRLNQTLDADQTLAADLVFTTNAPWSATVTESRATPSWLTLSPDHGDQAGTYTLHINLKANESESSRKATIRILCGKASIEIQITQRGAEQQTPDPEQGRLPYVAPEDRVVLVYNQDPDSYEDMPGTSPASRAVHYRYYGYAIGYDEQGRAKMVSECESSNADFEGYKINCSTEIDYTSGNDIIATKRYSDDYTENFYIELNDAGLLSEVSSTDGSNARYYYNDEGHLSRMIYENSWDGSTDIRYEWQEGNLTRVMIDSEMEITFEYTDYENTWHGADLFSLIDLNFTEFQNLSIAGLDAIHTRNLIARAYSDGETINFSYTFDEKGRVQRVLSAEAWIDHRFYYADQALPGEALPESTLVSEEVVDGYWEITSERNFRSSVRIRSHYDNGSSADRWETRDYYVEDDVMGMDYLELSAAEFSRFDFTGYNVLSIEKPSYDICGYYQIDANYGCISWNYVCNCALVSGQEAVQLYYEEGYYAPCPMPMPNASEFIHAGEMALDPYTGGVDEGYEVYQIEHKFYLDFTGSGRCDDFTQIVHAFREVVVTL